MGYAPLMIGNVAIFPTADILMTDPTTYTELAAVVWTTVKSYSVIQDLNMGSGFRWITQLARAGGVGQADARLLLNGVEIAQMNFVGGGWSGDLTVDVAGVTIWEPISTLELQIKGSVGAVGAATRANRLCGAYSPFLM